MLKFVKLYFYNKALVAMNWNLLALENTWNQFLNFKYIAL